MARPRKGSGEGADKPAGTRIAKMRERLHKDARPAPDASATTAPVANLVLADIALRGGAMLLRTAVNRGISAMGGAPRANVGQRFVTTTLAKVATRSVPGAIVIGGGLLAKTLYDRAHARKKAPGAAEPSEAGDD